MYILIVVAVIKNINNKEVMHQCACVKDVAGAIWTFVDDVRGPAPMVAGVERSFIGAAESLSSV